MKLYSLEKIERVKEQDNLYDLFYPILKDIDIKNFILKKYIVKEERSMRIDLICLDIYNSIDYIDELMHINNIIDPYSIKKGDVIYYISIEDLKLYRDSYININNLISDNNFDKKLTISIPDDSYIPVMVDKDKKQIKIVNKLK